MPFLVKFTCEYVIDATCIKEELVSDNFQKYFLDSVVTEELVETIVSSNEYLDIIYKEFKSDKYLRDIELSCDETAEDSFNSLLKMFIKQKKGYFTK